ncbi:serine ammonia-lyase [Serinicoccus chungangensis]|uniref:L-serine dehydratase n=1 Tax=Serinicoccus chungangensis TaxID=767452 RepID=A0A0W8I690_9MICO|nr:L-serine ammonia-lyase [Serinicoccus chungangensis]KUG53778.1 serine ammonia-lyase [Serinicoccus chungangensis]
MALSVLDLFTVGIGPSSSHTVGPMRAARIFAEGLDTDGVLPGVARVRAELFGSLGATGHGHGSDRAVVLGLEGEDPETVDTATVAQRVADVRERGRVSLLGRVEVGLAEDDLVLHRRLTLPGHPNGMTFRACAADGTVLRERTYYSVGGGFVVDEAALGADRVVPDDTPLPHPFGTGAELLARCREQGVDVAGLVRRNEEAFRPWEQTRTQLLHLWSVKQECVAAGLAHEGTLPGGLRVRRRAPLLHTRLQEQGLPDDPWRAMDWIDLWAMAVNEENASGGRVVTAPTNGAAGSIPAVLHYYRRLVPGADDDGVVDFLLAAGAIGIIIKENASISGAEVGCQGEVGSASAMAAAGLTQVLGGTPEQVEAAAEIGVEHHLGLTCDPVGGLVQIPCIERNAVGAMKAVHAARLARHGDGTHTVSLDQAVRTMRQTGRDMKRKYKETSRGGLAVNVVEC